MVGQNKIKFINEKLNFRIWLFRNSSQDLQFGNTKKILYTMQILN